MFEQSFVRKRVKLDSKAERISFDASHNHSFVRRLYSSSEGEIAFEVESSQC